MARGDPEQNRLVGQRLDIPVAFVLRSGYDPPAEGLWSAMKTPRAEYSGWRFPVQLLKSAMGLDCAFSLGPVQHEVADG